MSVFKKFPRVFWAANTMELFERWAWYGVFNVLAIYLTSSTDVGGLGFSQTQKGDIMGVVTAVLYSLPIFTGTLADKFGFKRTLVLAYAVLASGYYFMGEVTSYQNMFWVFMYVAVGAALFKPIISATIAKTTDSETSSIGFGIFYMMVNLGGFIGPFCTSNLRNISWDYVFWMASAVIVVNLIILLIFYKEPKRVQSDESILQAFKQSILNIFKVLGDWRYVIFLVIMVGFWTMFNQLFYTLPNFIEQWVDTRILFQGIKSIFGSAANIFDNGKGEMNAEMLINFDSASIVLFQVLISTLVMRLKPLNAMMAGILVATIGVCIAFVSGNSMYTFIGIFVFSIGEMSSSPKFTEYIGRIAPNDKAGLYMGTSFLPIAVGNYFAGVISGSVYEGMSDKYTLLRRELAVRNLSVPELSDKFTLTDFYTQSSSALNMSQEEITRMLWDTYHPSQIWNLFAVIGGAAVVCLWLYDRFLVPKPKTKGTLNMK